MLPKFIEQRPCVFQIGRVESLGEPAVDRRKELAGFIMLSLRLPKAAEPDRGTQLEGFCLLTARHVRGMVQSALSVRLLAAAEQEIADAVARLKRHTALPVAVGFGITTSEKAGKVAAVADAAVVGSAIVNRIAANLDGDGRARPGLVADVAGFVRSLAQGVRAGRP